MLKKLIVDGYRNFDKKYVFDLSNPKNYSWGEENIVDGVINNAIIYGVSGSGKSNLGKVIQDVRDSVVKGKVEVNKSDNFLNQARTINSAKISFILKFTKDKDIIYNIEKKGTNEIIEESLYIGEDLIFSYNFIEQEKIINEKSLVDLKIEGIKSSTSALGYIYNFNNLDELHPINLVYNFLEKFNYVDEGASGNVHFNIGEGLSEKLIEIINVGLEKTFNELEFEEFPRINSKTNEVEMKFKERVLTFSESASNGQKALFNFTIHRLLCDLKDVSSDIKKDVEEKINVLGEEYIIKGEPVALFYYDEFDAYYDTSLSRKILDIMQKNNVQVICTTHNTNLISNSILRPDCYFEIDNNCIKPLSDRTSKEIRRGHALEKMFLSGVFNFIDNNE